MAQSIGTNTPDQIFIIASCVLFLIILGCVISTLWRRRRERRNYENGLIITPSPSSSSSTTNIIISPSPTPLLYSQTPSAPLPPQYGTCYTS